MIETVEGALELRIRTLLPEQYQDTYEAIQPTPMRSAGLEYDPDGNVAWDRMWGSFCDLAMAGGPPHKGRLLEPGTEARSTRSSAATTRWSKRSAAASGW